MELRRGRRKEPKVQRGISITRQLHDEIEREADKYDLTWSEVAEQILERVLLRPDRPLQKTAQTVKDSQGDDVLVVTE